MLIYTSKILPKPGSNVVAAKTNSQLKSFSAFIGLIVNNYVRKMDKKNIFGEVISTCSDNPKTGYFRDGCCNTDASDVGEHTVCIVATDEFLTFSKRVGNDLSTPVPAYSFPGVKAGDRWCLCALRWVEAYRNNCAPKIILEATNETVLKHIPMKTLLEFAYYREQDKTKPS